MKNRFLFFLCAILVMSMGIVDTLRGLFAPLFSGVFGFSIEQITLIVSLSYLGSLFCLFSGGPAIKRLGERKAVIAFIVILILAVAMLFLGSTYVLLAAGFFLAVGMTTILNICVNLLADNFSRDDTIRYVNILFFIQMIGFIVPQFLLSPFVYSKSAWQTTTATIAVVLALLAVGFHRAKIEIPEKNGNGKNEEGNGNGNGKSLFSLVMVTLVLTFYLIGEHGTINYFMSYGTVGLGMDSGLVGIYLAIFFTGMMIGRLAFSTVIAKIGNVLSIMLSLAVALASFLLVYRAGMLPLIFVSGLGCAIVYPTSVAMARLCVEREKGATATTLAMAFASLADVFFNLGYGKVIDALGFSVAILAIPLAIAIGLVFSIVLLVAKGRNLG